MSATEACWVSRTWEVVKRHVSHGRSSAGSKFLNAKFLEDMEYVWYVLHILPLN